MRQQVLDVSSFSKQAQQVIALLNRNRERVGAHLSVARDLQEAYDGLAMQVLDMMQQYEKRLEENDRELKELRGKLEEYFPEAREVEEAKVGDEPGRGT